MVRMGDVMQKRNMPRTLGCVAGRQVQNKFGKCCRESSDPAWPHSALLAARVGKNVTGVCHHQATPRGMQVLDKDAVPWTNCID